MESIKAKSTDLKNEGTNLQNSFDGIKNDLDTAANNCAGDAACQSSIEAYKSKLSMEVDFTNLPDIQASLDDVDDVYTLNISKNVDEVSSLELT